MTYAIIEAESSQTDNCGQVGQHDLCRLRASACVFL